jgi:hypothetical protein
MKIKATKIEILWSENSTINSRSPHVFEGESCWRESRKLLVGAAIAISDDEVGYDKTGFKVTWEDGETYEGRACLKSLSKKNNDTDLALHIFMFCIFDAGLAMSPEYRSQWDWLSPDKYEEIMESMGTEKQEYIDFLNKYEIEVFNEEKVYTAA